VKDETKKKLAEYMKLLNQVDPAVEQFVQKHEDDTKFMAYVRAHAAIVTGWSQGLTLLNQDGESKASARLIVTGDFLTNEMADLAAKIGPNRVRLQKEVVEPNMAEINRKLGQENDPAYLAYVIVYALQQGTVVDHPSKGSRWKGPEGLEVEVILATQGFISVTLINAPLRAHDWHETARLSRVDWDQMRLIEVKDVT
jgi:hypothetical protein